MVSGLKPAYCALGWAIFVFAFLQVRPFVVDAHAQQARTVGEGVYTAEQATRGQTLYKDRCATCHGAALEGSQAPPLTGPEFVGDWGGPLLGLFDKIHNTMPANDPGKLTRLQAADLTAYLLQASKFPVGRAELGSDESVLTQITVPAAQASAARQPVAPGAAPSFPPFGNMAQVMRGILFPSANLIFNAQSHDPGIPVPIANTTAAAGGFSWVNWGAGIYSGWEMVDYAAVALAESAPLMLTPGRRCENGKPVPVQDPEWIKFSMELAQAGKAAYKASQTRNQDNVIEVTNLITDSCSNCHQVYRDKRGAIRAGPDPSNKAARCVK